MAELRAETISVRAGAATLVDGASLRLGPGNLVALLGANGAGKSTLLRACLGLTRPSAGRATLEGDCTAGMSPGKRAARVAYLPQFRSLAWPNAVRDVVALGRFSHGATLGRLGPADARAVDTALDDCDLSRLAGRSVDTLSGGELARVHCARAFASGAPLIVADEPIAGLDPLHQFRIMDLFQAFVARGGGALLVLHDIELAARYASRLLWMKRGRITADGTPADTLSAARIADTYGVRAQVAGARVELQGALATAGDAPGGS